MQRVLNRALSLKTNLNSIINKNVYKQGLRSASTINEIFPHKSEFPTRHIGPRKTDVVSMLELLGLKVIITKCIFFLLVGYNLIFFKTVIG